MSQFEGQVAIVTGGTRGIGRAISEMFLDQGATVIVTYAGNDAVAEEMKASSSAPERMHLRKFDVSKSDEVEAFYKDIDTLVEKVDMIVCNAGIRQDAFMALMKDEQWNRVIDVNLTGSFLMAKHAVKRMAKKRYGRVVFTSSPSSYMGLPGQANYSASKAGQIAMARSLSKEVAKRNITVNSILPGFIGTELIDDLPEDLVKEYLKNIPARKFGEPSDIANGVKYLCSKEASYVTGTTLEINGGL